MDEPRAGDLDLAAVLDCYAVTLKQLPIVTIKSGRMAGRWAPLSSKLRDSLVELLEQATAKLIEYSREEKLGESSVASEKKE